MLAYLAHSRSISPFKICSLNFLLLNFCTNTFVLRGYLLSFTSYILCAFVSVVCCSSASLLRSPSLFVCVSFDCDVFGLCCCDVRYSLSMNSVFQYIVCKLWRTFPSYSRPTTTTTTTKNTQIGMKFHRIIYTSNTSTDSNLNGISVEIVINIKI